MQGCLFGVYCLEIQAFASVIFDANVIFLENARNLLKTLA